MGNLSIYRVMLETGKRIQVTKPNLERHDRNSVRWDEAVYATWGDAAGIVLLS
ncbi:MAG: TOBE domain-containing protein [Geminicoccaceae bacterium]